MQGFHYAIAVNVIIQTNVHSTLPQRIISTLKITKRHF